MADLTLNPQIVAPSPNSGAMPTMFRGTLKDASNNVVQELDMGYYHGQIEAPFWFRGLDSGAYTLTVQGMDSHGNNIGPSFTSGPHQALDDTSTLPGAVVAGITAS
jgi:hypothetical protein